MPEAQKPPNDSGWRTESVSGQRMESQAGPARGWTKGSARRNILYGVALILLIAFFSRSLYALVRFSLQSDLYSHVLIIPFISLYLAWFRRATLDPQPLALRVRAIVLLLACGAVLSYVALPRATIFSEADNLAITTFGFLICFCALGFLYLGKSNFLRLRFPFGFLCLILPFPSLIEAKITATLQHGSALIARGLFATVGTPVYYHDLIFQLPGFALQVAPECSGIHSSWALFIVSLIAGFFFLHASWRRTVLALSVLPIALLRNGFRIATIGELCVRIGPEMINSPIHRHGGPYFFVLSLLPFGLLLWYLVRSEKRSAFND